jgi:hypothetical protein
LPPKETAVLETLFEQIHLHPDQGTYAIRHLTQGVNSNLARSSERFRLNARAVGAALTTLGFHNRTRTNLGYVVWLDRVAQERIHELMSTYSMEPLSTHLPTQGLNEPCEFCKSEDLQCSEPSPAGQLPSEPPTEQGTPDNSMAHQGESSEHRETEKCTTQSEVGTNLKIDGQSQKLISDLIRDDPEDFGLRP